MDWRVSRDSKEAKGEITLNAMPMDKRRKGTLAGISIIGIAIVTAFAEYFQD